MKKTHKMNGFRLYQKLNMKGKQELFEMILNDYL